MARERWVLAAVALVGALAALQAVRALRALGLPRISLEHTGIERLDPRTARALAELDGDVLATFCISARADLPSSERAVEREVTGLLERMRAAASGRFDFQVLDPDAHPELADYLAGQGIAPISVREVRFDRVVDHPVHATLTLAYGAHGRARIRGITSAHLADIEPLIVQELAELARPSRPVVALAGAAVAGGGARHFAAWLAERAELVEIDFDANAELPPRADLLIWLDPRSAGEAQVRALRRWLASGKSAVAAGSLFTERGSVPAGELALERSGSALDLLGAQFGVRYLERAVIDLGERASSDPAAVVSIGNDQDFRRMARQPNGTLLFRAPTALALDAAALAEQQTSATVLAASSPSARQVPAPFLPTPRDALRERAASVAAREPLLVLVAPSDPWSGSLVLAAASTPFADGVFEREDLANTELAASLLATLASTDRRALARAGPANTGRREPLPVLAPRERLGWRLFAIALVPALILAASLARGALSPHWRGTLSPQSIGRREPAWAGALVLVLVLGGFAAGSLPSWTLADLSAEQRHSLAPATRRAASALGDAEVRAELVTSRPLPPELSATAERARSLCGELARAGAPFELERVIPEELDPERRAALERAGVAPRAVETRDETAASVRAVTCALRLSRGEQSEVLDLTSPGSEASLEFRLAQALERLSTGRRRPRVLFAADAPRLSPAEAREQYEARALFAPRASEVYSQARAVLAALDFDVVAVDPAEPRADPEADLVVWMQPRRGIEPMLRVLVDHLGRGKPALVAGQHFEIQARALPDDELALAYWPRPQFCDLDRGWFADLGLPLVREVLCDRSSGAIAVDTEIRRGEKRGLELQALAQPFVIRALSSGFDARSPIASGLSDLLMPYANRFALDSVKLALHGLSVRELVRSTRETWSIDWKGGELTRADLEPAAPSNIGAQPLAVVAQGRFPDQDGSARPDAPAARLLLIGCSSMFQNERILDPEFRSAELLGDAAVALALSDDAASILARRPLQRGFATPSGGERAAWRAAVLGGGPLLVLLIAFAWRTALRGRLART